MTTTIYTLQDDLVLDQDSYKTLSFKKETVALSYIVDSKNPATKETTLSIVAVERSTGKILCGLNTRTFSGEAYSIVNSLFDIDGNLTPEGYEYALDNFTINSVTLRDIVEGPEELVIPDPEVPVEE